MRDIEVGDLLVGRDDANWKSILVVGLNKNGEEPERWTATVYICGSIPYQFNTHTCNLASLASLYMKT